MGYQVSKLQVVEPKYWSKFTTMEHLAAIGNYQPEIINQTLEYLYDVNLGYNFGSLINKLPVHYVDTGEVPYRWAMIGGEERPIPLVKATSDAAGSNVFAATDKPGQYDTTFYMWFAEDYFSITSVIFGSKPESYALRIVSEPVAYGDMYRCEVKILGNDTKAFVPVADLSADSLWVEGWGAAEQALSKRGNSIHHGTHFMFENTLSVIRKNYEVPGNVLRNGTSNNPLAFQFKDLETGQTTKKWVDKQAWDFYRQFRNDAFRLDLYGKSNKGLNGEYKDKGESGNILKAGFGLYDQVNNGNVSYYNKFSIDALLDFLLTVFVGKFREDQRKIVMTCGEYGAAQFHKAVMNKPGGATFAPFFRSDYPYEQGKDGKATWNERQFNHYKWINGIEISIIVDSQKDSPWHVLKHPDGGNVASYVYDIFDFGTTDGQANIMRVLQRNYEETFGYVPGIFDPFTPGGKAGNPKTIVSPVDGYAVYGWKQRSIMVKNPIKTGRFVPAIYR